MSVSENINPKKNPVTSLLGGLFILIGAGMYIVKYLVPAFVVLKQPIEFGDWVPVIPIFIGVLLVFIDDNYFSRIFNRGEKIVAKKTDTE